MADSQWWYDINKYAYSSYLGRGASVRESQLSSFDNFHPDPITGYLTALSTTIRNSVEAKRKKESLSSTIGFNYYVYDLEKPTSFLKVARLPDKRGFTNDDFTSIMGVSKRVYAIFDGLFTIIDEVSTVKFKIVAEDVGKIVFNNRVIGEMTYGGIESSSVEVISGKEYPIEFHYININGLGSMELFVQYNNNGVWFPFPLIKTSIRSDRSMLALKAFIVPAEIEEQLERVDSIQRMGDYEIFIPVSPFQALRVIRGLVSRNGANDSKGDIYSSVYLRGNLYRITFVKSYEYYPMVMVSQYASLTPGQVTFFPSRIEKSGFVVSGFDSVFKTYTSMHFQFMAMGLVNHVSSSPYRIERDISSLYGEVVEMKNSTKLVVDNMLQMVNDKFSKWEVRNGDNILTALSSLGERVEELEKLSKESFLAYPSSSTLTSHPFQPYYETPSSYRRMEILKRGEKEPFCCTHHPYAIKYYDRISSLCHPLKSDVSTMRKIAKMTTKEGFEIKKIKTFVDDEKEKIFAIIIIAAILGISIYAFSSPSSSKKK
jgi:hypothetical protein